MPVSSEFADPRFRFCPQCSEPLLAVADGNQHRMGCSRSECGFIHYRNPVPAAGALIVADRRVLLVQRAIEPRIGHWCLPAGFMEWSEHPAATAIREVREETGLTIRLTSLFAVYAGSDDPRTRAILILYLAEAIGGTLQAADDALAVDWFPLAQLPESLAFASHRQAIDEYLDRYGA